METKSYAAEVIADDSGKWVGNGCRFATREEAQLYVLSLASRWMLVTQTRVVESPDAVNYVIDDEGRMAHVGGD